jgi:hypothetical protein
MSICCFTAVLIVLTAKPPQVDFMAVLRNGERERASACEALKNGPTTTGNHPTRRQSVSPSKSHSTEIASLERMRGRYLPTVVLSVGSVGVARTDVKVEQIQGPRDMLIQWPDGHDSTLVWLRGLSTKNLTDGSQLNIGSTLWVVGTKTYKTVMGAGATVFLIQVVTIPDDAYKAFQNELAQQDRAAEQSAQQEAQRQNALRDAKKPQFRDWRIAGRDRPVRAKLRGVIGNNVKLTLQSGDVLSVALDQIGDEDRAYIAARAKGR